MYALQVNPEKSWRLVPKKPEKHFSRTGRKIWINRNVSSPSFASLSLKKWRGIYLGEMKRNCCVADNDCEIWLADYLNASESERSLRIFCCTSHYRISLLSYGVGLKNLFNSKCSRWWNHCVILQNSRLCLLNAISVYRALNRFLPASSKGLRLSKSTSEAARHIDSMFERPQLPRPIRL